MTIDEIRIMDESIKRAITPIKFSPELEFAHLHVSISKNHSSTMHTSGNYPIIIEMYNAKEEDSADRMLLNYIETLKPCTLKICYKRSAHSTYLRFPCARNGTGLF